MYYTEFAEQFGFGGLWSKFPPGTAGTAQPSFTAWFLALDESPTIRALHARSHFVPRIMLASQRGLRLGGLLGAQRRVRRCPSSLGGVTPAGAADSQGKLHALRSDRPTVTALLLRGWLTPAFALLTPSGSNVTRIKIKGFYEDF
jgi:hypothetical protein